MCKCGIHKKLSITLRKTDSGRIHALLSAGVQSVRVIKRAQALRLLAEGQLSPQVGCSVGLNPKTVRNIGWRYAQAGLERALYDRPRPGASPLLTGIQKQQIIAMVCSDPPEGRARWTIRLIAEESIRRKLVATVGRETIRILLQRHESKPWRIKSWCVAELTPEYIHKMEGVLATYERPGMRNSRWSAWTKSRCRCWPMCGRLFPPENRRRLPNRITSMHGAERPISSAAWNRRVGGTLPKSRPRGAGRSSLR